MDPVIWAVIGLLGGCALTLAAIAIIDELRLVPPQDTGMLPVAFQQSFTKA